MTTPVPDLTRLSLGCAWLGPPRSTAADAHATLRRALESGIGYVDTAPLYNAGASELSVGEALHGVPRESYVISTKVGRRIRTEDGITAVVEDYTPTGMRRSLEESLDRLRLDRVDIAYLHDPNKVDRGAALASYAELERMRDEGLIDAIGVGVNQVAYAEPFLDRHAVDLVLLAGRWTLLDRSAAPFLTTCKERGTRVVAAGVYNAGILADPHQPAPSYDYRPAGPEVVAHARVLDALCRRHGVPLKAAALQFPFTHRAVATVLVGADTPSQVDENAALITHPIPTELWSDLAGSTA